MTVRDFEILHGIVLTKLTQKERSITLHMIETKLEKSWSACIINDKVLLVIKHRTRPRKARHKRGGLSWNFVINTDQVKQIRILQRQKPVHLVLVCGGGTLKKNQTEICLIHPTELRKLLDTSSFFQQSVIIKVQHRKELWVSSRRTEIKIPRNRFDNWKVPSH